MSQKIKKSIKTKVIFRVTAIVAVVLILAFSYILYSSISNLKQIADIKLNQKANDLASHLELRLEYLQENTQLLATNELLINAFNDQKDKDEYLFALINNFRTGKFLNSLSLVDFDGRVIFQSDKTTYKFKESQELRLSINLSQTITKLNQEKKEIIFIVPIIYYGSTQGAIIATYNFNNIIDRYSENEKFIYRAPLKTPA